MNNNDIDEWLNSLEENINSRLQAPQTVEVTPHADNQVHFHMPDGETIDVPIVEDPIVSVVVAQQSTVPENISAQDFADLLTDIGINSPSEEAQAEEIPTEVSASGFSPEESQEPSDLATEAIRESSVPLDLSVDSNTQEPLIPENSPTLLMDDSTSRFSGTEWYNEIQKKRVTMAGLGGIGSWMSLLIGRMGLQTIILFDDDKVEMTNMSGQLYSREEIGEYKAGAMRKLINKYTSTLSVYAIRRRFTEEDNPGDIMICGFDNMEARKTFFNSWKHHISGITEDQKKQCLFIDGRLSIDTLQVFCIQGNDLEAQIRYESNYLFSDEEADETVCSMKQTSYLAAMIGSVITNLFTNWVANSIDPIIPYDLPFYTEYNAQHMIFKTEH